MRRRGTPGTLSHPPTEGRGECWFIGSPTKRRTAIFILWALGGSLHAQLPLAQLSSVFPPGARAGSTQAVTISGVDLDDPARLVFSDPRIAAIPKAGQPSTFDVRVPAAVSPGIVDVRFEGRFGRSNPRAFAIGDSAEITMEPTNTTLETAISLPAGTVANGRMKAGAALWYRFQAPAGGRMIAEVAARTLDSRLEPVLTLFDNSGREVGHSVHGWIETCSETASDFLLRLHDVTYRGGDEYVFRVHATAGPYLDFAIPALLQRGRTNRVVVFGRNLPGGRISEIQGTDGSRLEQLETEVVAAPAAGSGEMPGAELASAGLGAFGWSMDSGMGRSNPLCFALADASISNSICESSCPPGLTDVTPPCAYAALFAKAGELAGVRFNARKGQVWWMEVIADRLGFVVDPSVVVQRIPTANGAESSPSDVLELPQLDREFGGPGYPTATRDSAGRFEAPEDGTYRVVVRDLFHLLASQSRYPFELLIRPETPDFHLVATPVAQPSGDPNQRQLHPWCTFLRRGEALPVRVLAFRQDGFDGDIEVKATSLPAGVTAASVTIDAGRHTAEVLLQASDDAPAWSGSIGFEGRARVRGAEVAHAAAAASIVWSVSDYNQEASAVRFTDPLTLAVSGNEWAPVVVEPADPKPVACRQDDKVSIPLRILRQGEFNAELKLKVDGPPVLQKLAELVVPAGGTNAMLAFDLAEKKLPAGTHTLYLHGLTSGKYRRDPPEVLAAAESELKAARDRLSAADPAGKPKAELAVHLAEEGRKAAEERVKPRDVTVAVYSRAIQLVVDPAGEKKEGP